MTEREEHAGRLRSRGLLRRVRAAVAGWAMVLAACLSLVLPAPIARADPRDDFVAGRTRVCPKCDLAGVNLKRRDLTGVDLTGAILRAANLHDAQLAGARL